MERNLFDGQHKPPRKWKHFHCPHHLSQKTKQNKNKTYDPPLIKQMMKSILVKGEKMTLEIHFAKNISCIEPKFTNVFLANVSCSPDDPPMTTGPQRPQQQNPGPDSVPAALSERSVARGSAALPEPRPHAPFSLLFFSSFVLWPPCVLTT